MQMTTSLLLSCLVLCSSCQRTDSSVDQSPNTSGDMSGTGTPDAADPNAPGLVRYTYTCGNNPAKTISLPHERFGALYKCLFTPDVFNITVTDDRIPVQFRLGITNYHGPSTYTVIADAVSGTGFSECKWSSIEVADKNCPALWTNTFTPCCSTMEARAKALSCTVVVQQHSLTRVSGTFDCRIQTEKYDSQTPIYCPPTLSAHVEGSFDFGPKDCQ